MFFNAALNTTTVFASADAVGRAIHNVGPATEKERRPLRSMYRGTDNKLWSADFNRRAGACVVINADRYTRAR